MPSSRTEQTTSINETILRIVSYVADTASEIVRLGWIGDTHNNRLNRAKVIMEEYTRTVSSDSVISKRFVADLHWKFVERMEDDCVAAERYSDYLVSSTKGMSESRRRRREEEMRLWDRICSQISALLQWLVKFEDGVKLNASPLRSAIRHLTPHNKHVSFAKSNYKSMDDLTQGMSSISVVDRPRTLARHSSIYASSMMSNAGSAWTDANRSSRYTTPTRLGDITSASRYHRSHHHRSSKSRDHRPTTLVYYHSEGDRHHSHQSAQVQCVVPGQVYMHQSGYSLEYRHRF